MATNRCGGSSHAAVLIYIMVAIIGIYAAIKTVPPYMDYYSMEDEVRQQLHLAAINPDNVILEDLARKAQELGLPIKSEDIILEHGEDGSTRIDIKWAVDVDFGYGFRRVYNFEIKNSNKEIEK